MLVIREEIAKIERGEWDKINPKFVPSLCFQKYKKAFIDPKEEKKNSLGLKKSHEMNALPAAEQTNL